MYLPASGRAYQECDHSNRLHGRELSTENFVESLSVSRGHWVVSETGLTGTNRRKHRLGQSGFLTVLWVK